MTEQIRKHAAKLGNLNFIPRTHIAEEPPEN